MRHANCSGTSGAREPGPPTNAVDPIIAIAAVGAVTWTYQQPVATMRDYSNYKILFALLINLYRHQDLQL